ncbi:MAG TPA: FecR domain-containing protein [Prevotella sp.]
MENDSKHNESVNEEILVELSEHIPDEDRLAELADDPTFCETFQHMNDLQTVVRKTYRPIDVEHYLHLFHRSHSSGSAVWKFLPYVLAGAAAVVCAFLLFPRLHSTEENAPAPVYTASEPQQVTVNYDGVSHVAKAQNGHTVTIGHEDYLLQTSEKQRVLLSVPYGNSAMVTLPDGSVAYVHAGSRLVFANRYLHGQRVVKLEGEAYLKVKHDARHPFVILAGHTRTTVLGTELNISSKEDGKTVVTLITGKVEVASNARRLTMKPGQQATAGKDAITACEVDTTAYTNWRDGYFYFDKVPLKDIMEAIGQHYNMTVVFNNASSMHYNMHFVAEYTKGIEGVVDKMNRMGKAKVSLQGNRIVVD